MRAGLLRHTASVQIPGLVTKDSIGSYTEENWNEVCKWPVSCEDKPFVFSEIKNDMLFIVNGRYRQDLMDLFIAGKSIRIVVDGFTLKVLQFEKLNHMRRTLRAHCGLAVRAT